MNAKPTKRTVAISWDEVRERLQRTVLATDDESLFDQDRARAIMDERARILARVPHQPPGAGEVMELATFALANERYAVERCYVREIVRLGGYTPVPGTPDFLVGVINLRGEILAVVDLGWFFGLAQQSANRSRVIVLGREHAELGLVADEAHEMTVLRKEDLLEPPMGASREYLRVTKDALIVLDGAALLQDTRLFIDQGEEVVA